MHCLPREISKHADSRWELAPVTIDGSTGRDSATLEKCFCGGGGNGSVCDLVPRGRVVALEGCGGDPLVYAFGECHGVGVGGGDDSGDADVAAVAHFDLSVVCADRCGQCVDGAVRGR